MQYRFDGTFPGLLTTLHRVFAWQEIPESIAAGDDIQADLFHPPVDIVTDTGKAARFWTALQRRLSRESLGHVWRAFLADRPEAPLAICRYLARARVLGRRVDDHLADDAVRSVHGLSRRVSREAHRLKGLARFRELADGTLYAPLEPDHQVLPLLAPHFHARLGRQRWLIHDTRRGVAALGDGENWELAEIAGSAPLSFSADETACRELWRTFFRDIAIPERTNPRLQRQFMPKKYWRHLVEME
jgi:probable DNA metabolism protein